MGEIEDGGVGNLFGKISRCSTCNGCRMIVGRILAVKIIFSKVIFDESSSSIIKIENKISKRCSFFGSYSKSPKTTSVLKANLCSLFKILP